MIGKTVLHYNILSKLGEGGMGVVYRAEDTKLKREVAIKFLTRQIAASEEERERFKIEAQAAAALNHANIATIYNIEESEEETFIVMEYVKGEELKDRIETGPLAVEETLDLAVQIAKGLQTAHEEGIVHRDIKSANIMLTHKGDVKIMDFGLAKRGRQSRLTKEGTTLGTVAYMSPEQARGDEVDQRSDIFSLGVLLYEMLSGQLPFKGDYDQAVTYSVLNEEAAPLTGLRTGLPLELERIVNKCLEKETSVRYQHVDELIADLLKLMQISQAHPVASDVINPAGFGPRSKNAIVSYAVIAITLLIAVYFGLFQNKGADIVDSIAVLPLENLSQDADQEFFVDGMTDAIITELSKISALRVISRTSVMQYKNANKSLASIANELNVKSILEGTVIQSDEKVRIATQLIGFSPERHLWANNYDRELTDFLNLSSEVASEIAKEIKITMTPEEESRLQQVRLVDPEANRLYLKAGYQMSKSTTREATEKAIEDLQKAIDIDPDFALAYVELADAYLNLENRGYAPGETVLPKAESLLLSALEIDSTLSVAHESLSFIRFRRDFNWQRREQDLKKAIRLNSSDAGFHGQYALLLSFLGRHDEAIRESQIALRLDPVSLSTNTLLGRSYYYAGRYDEAIETLRTTLELEPDAINPKWWLGRVYTDKGMFDEAIAEFLSRKVNSPETNFALAYTYAVSGQSEKARKILEFLLQKEKETYVPPNILAMIYIGLGDFDQAFAWLEKAGPITSIKAEPWHKALRHDPRFEELLRRVNLSDE